MPTFIRFDRVLGSFATGPTVTTMRSLAMAALLLMTAISCTSATSEPAPTAARSSNTTGHGSGSSPWPVAAVAVGSPAAAAAPSPVDLPPELDPDVDEPPSRPPGTTRMRMQAHFDELRTIERLILDGDLDRVRDHAFAIVFDRPESELPLWAPYITRMRDAAAVLARSESIAAACRAETRLAAECAACHVASGAMPTFVVPALPADVPTLASRMARHQWAVDRLWEGLVGLSDQAWLDGTAVLAAAALPVTAISSDPDQRQRLAGQTRSLQRAARRAGTAKTPSSRANAYGVLLVVCSGCHSARDSEPATDR